MNTTPFEDSGVELLSALSHELRNPLATILSAVELLRLQEGHSPGAVLLLETIEGRVRAMTEILADLLVSTMPPPLLRSSFSSGVVRVRGESVRSILLVDDNVLAAQALGTLLELRGYEVSVAHSGVEAIQKAREGSPDVLLLDIGLPDMSGYDVARVLHKDTKYTPTLIALTGFGQAQDIARATQEGFAFHLTKPIGIEAVEELLRTLTPFGQEVLLS